MLFLVLNKAISLTLRKTHAIATLSHRRYDFDSMEDNKMKPLLIKNKNKNPTCFKGIKSIEIGYDFNKKPCLRYFCKVIIKIR